MKHRKSRTTDIHYYSDRLKQKLSQLRFAPATVVEAPSGYGKTTAIRDVLKHGIPQGTPVHWFAAVEESPQAGFRRLCCTINKIDNRAGERLLKIGLPNSANVGEACVALRSIQCNQEPVDEGAGLLLPFVVRYPVPLSTCQPLVRSSTMETMG